MANSLHLDQEFSLDSSGGFILSIGAVAAHGVDFVDEDDGRLFLTGGVEECLDELLALADVLAHQIG